MVMEISEDVNLIRYVSRFLVACTRMNEKPIPSIRIRMKSMPDHIEIPGYAFMLWHHPGGSRRDWAGKTRFR